MRSLLLFLVLSILAGTFIIASVALLCAGLYTLIGAAAYGQVAGCVALTVTSLVVGAFFLTRNSL